MTYWGLNSIFLAVVAVLGIAAVVMNARRARADKAAGTGSGAASGRAGTALPVILVASILIAMTAIFDNVMIGIGLVGYDASKISGVFVGIAPLEDFAYAVAALILLPSLWVLLAPRERHGAAR